jgi:hypothetical protein
MTQSGQFEPAIAAVSIWQKLTTPWQQITRQTQINAAEIV